MSASNLTDLMVPQLGEGLTEVLIRELLKKPGDSIRRDEPIYVMETDKALVDAESPADGILQEWLVAADDVVTVGCPVARILVNGQEAGFTPERAPGWMPQRAGELTGPACISEPTPAVVHPIAKPDDPRERPASDLTPGQEYVESTLPPSQRALVFRLNRSARMAVPGNIGRPIEWQRVIDLTKAFSQKHAGAPLAELHAFAYCVAQGAKAHPKFRSTLLGNATVRAYRHLTLGIAVARPGDELVTAVIPDADRLSLTDFITLLHRQMRRAWTRGDQAGPTTQLLLSSLEAEGITDGVPTLVTPASATLFVGAVYQDHGKPVAKLSLTFDHRLINGMAAARFLNSIDKEIDRLKAALSNE